MTLQQPLRQALSQLRGLVEIPDAFDPATSQRRFRISGGDYVGMVLLPPLIQALEIMAPNIDLRLRFIEKDRIPVCLDADEIDLALCVADQLPPRFLSEVLFEEDFVCIARADHPIAGQLVTPERSLASEALIAGCPTPIIAAALETLRVSRSASSDAINPNSNFFI